MAFSQEPKQWQEEDGNWRARAWEVEAGGAIELMLHGPGGIRLRKRFDAALSITDVKARLDIFKSEINTALANYQTQVDAL